jgi:hypothetical protein
MLGSMLGVRRASITQAAGSLRSVGIIAYQRGFVTILDRPGLEDAACEDYRITREAYDRALR